MPHNRSSVQPHTSVDKNRSQKLSLIKKTFCLNSNMHHHADLACNAFLRDHWDEMSCTHSTLALLHFSTTFCTICMWSRRGLCVVFVLFILIWGILLWNGIYVTTAVCKWPRQHARQLTKNETQNTIGMSCWENINAHRG